MRTLTRSRDTTYEGKPMPALAALDGIRVIACVWLILLSTAQGPGGSSMQNPGRLLDFFQMLPFTVIVSANLALDEFFVLSAFLTTIKVIPLIRSGEKEEVAEDGQR